MRIGVRGLAGRDSECLDAMPVGLYGINDDLLRSKADAIWLCVRDSRMTISNGIQLNLRSISGQTVPPFVEEARHAQDNFSNPSSSWRSRLVSWERG